MEMEVNAGMGYVPAERDPNEAQVIGVIPIDALYSPIRKVNNTVTNARVGQRTDYDKLTLEIWTDGSIIPRDAMAFAAKILKEQLTIFINFKEDDETYEEQEEGKETGVNENLFRSVDELELSVRSSNCLKNADIHPVSYTHLTLPTN